MKLWWHYYVWGAVTGFIFAGLHLFVIEQIRIGMK